MLNIAHIHPMLVHFPLALLPLVIAAQLLVVFKGDGLFDRSCLSSTAMVLLALAAVAAIFAAVFGDLALDQALTTGVPLASLETHEELGQLTAVVLSTLAAIELWFYRKRHNGLALDWSFLLLGVGTLILLLSTAWFGGQLVYDLGVNVMTTR